MNVFDVRTFLFIISLAASASPNKIDDGNDESIYTLVSIDTPTPVVNKPVTLYTSLITSFGL